MTARRTLAETRDALDARRLTATELLDELLAAMERDERVIRAMVTRTLELARDQAAKADVRLAAGERTPLLGIPIVLKDLIDVEGVPTTAGSRVLAGNVPRSSAPVWHRLESAGAVLLGKANTHEFAYGGTTEPTRNPSDPSRIVGGSSGGSAAALAAGFALGAVGTDTAGSIRIPANLCGVAALKPTRGLVPADGVIPLSPTLDVVAPIARRAADLDPLLRVMAALPAGPQVRHRPARVGVVTNTGVAAASVIKAVRTATAAFTELGADVVELELPGLEQSVFDDFTVIAFEATQLHRRWADRRDLYTPYVRDRLAAAADVTRAQYDEALRAARLLEAHVDALLDRVDVLLLAGVPFPASPAYDDVVVVGEGEEDRDTALCRNTAFANLTGHPVLALPAGLDDGLPVGVQLVGRQGADLQLVQVGAQVEALLPPGLPPHLLG
jgi:aspartyl-tRNA(Asn)/glutamyl-tRNA(Gln) amidotransferase subunit A